MDTTAEEIAFDVNGICSFCHYFDKNIKFILDRSYSEQGKNLLYQIITTIKKSRHNRPYDSVLGISGGMDSSYLAYKAVELGLRPLAVHIDMGWNSPESERNVKNLISKLSLELEIIYVDWETMRNLQVAFYKASVKNCEIPQDHAFLAALYRKAAELGVHFVLSGGNYATESILPSSWGYNAGDLRHLLAIHRRFGTKSLRKFPKLSFWRRYIYYPFVRKIREVRLLNYVSYNKAKAKRVLIDNFNWRDYGPKHFESVLTRFFQGYYLPTKFGIDKRKAHLSSLILSEQITREEALEELKKPPYPYQELLQEDKNYIAHRLGLQLPEWEEILNLPPRQHGDFPSSKWLFSIKNALVDISGIRRRRYVLQ
jgi:N-acetyl sugar amidotransferase